MKNPFIKTFTILVFVCMAFASQVMCVEVEVIDDLVFTVQNGKELAGDAYVPEGDGPFPIVVAVHGGGFVRGDKKDIARQCRIIAEAGYVVFSSNYRTLSMGAKFPDFIKDTHSAVKWIRKHAAEYKGDPENIGITGFSAGSYIASYVAVTSHITQVQHKDDGLEDVSSKVNALAAFYGHHDLLVLDEVQRNTAKFIWGGQVTDKVLKRASPASYLDYAVPTVLFHNEIDSLVPVEQSRSMYAKLKEAGVEVYYYEFPEKAHDLLRPDEDWALGVTIDFFDKQLKKVDGIEFPESIPPRE